MAIVAPRSRRRAGSMMRRPPRPRLDIRHCASIRRTDNGERRSLFAERTMSYRSLLVVLDERAAKRLDLAVQLARRFDAHLVGLAPTGRVTVPIDGALGVAGPAAFEPVWEGLRLRA